MDTAELEAIGDEVLQNPNDEEQRITEATGNQEQPRDNSDEQ